MTTERRGLFVFRTDDTGTKCAAECPHLALGATFACFQYERRDAFGSTPRRHAACIAAEQAAQKAEAKETESQDGR